MSDPANLSAVLGTARRWLFESACPLWAGPGLDTVHGGAFDRLSFERHPTGDFKRTRVQARQIYAFLACGRLFGTPKWQAEADALYEFLTTACRRPDGSFCFHISLDGKTQDDVRDNYDQAFALFALAHYYRVTNRAGARDHALALMAYLRTHRKHPVYGFYENDDRTGGLLTNPHMHYLEAMLAWAKTDDSPVWLETADEIVPLATDKLIDPACGGIREYFDGDWQPVAGPRGRVLEPGHQLEWATLLDLYGKARPEAAPRLAATIDRLYTLATEHGLGPDGIHIHSEIDTDFAVVKPDARCWTYTERLRAALMMAARHPEDRARYEDHALKAWQGLWRYLDTPVPGLWRDWIALDGTVTEEDAPASSLYHIVGAISALDTAMGGQA